MKRLTSLYRELYGNEPNCITPITGSGSPRQYFRLSGNTDTTPSVIGVIGTSLQENEAFIGLTQHFYNNQLSVPTILAISSDRMAYLQSDLGQTSLYDAISEGRKNGGCYSSHEIELLRATISALPSMQIKGAKGLDTSLCYPTPRMDAQSVLFDLNYFKYCFLKFLSGLDFNEIELQRDFETLCNDICSLIDESTPTLILRDCQARNIMLVDHEGHAEPYFIDYQGCRLGPVEYDLASFLWQSSARYSQDLREELIEVYLKALNSLLPTNPTVLHQRLQLMVLFRLLQVLGAYGFRGYHEHKTYFLQSIPPAIVNLEQVLSQGSSDPYPYLKEILLKVVSIIKSQQAAIADCLTPTQPKKDAEPLTVTIWSFSFKRGIPEDPSGNGGGYVFDCRSTHNPGKYEPYKKINGLNASVIQFLEEDGEILAFLEHVYPLAQHHVERFISRGFTSLTFCFGCTGGQHRSVYSAQHLAERLRNLYPQIRIHLIHREQKIDTWL